MNSPQLSHSLRLVGIVVLVLSVLSVRPALAAWPHSPGTNVPICTASGEQTVPQSISDGAGGAIIVWEDTRTDLARDIYVQRVRASGVVDPPWPANGRAVCTATATQARAQIISDGAGGAIVTWEDIRNVSDYDIYAQHVLATGAVDPAWPANGRLICGAPSHQQLAAIVSDGAGGAIVAWDDYRTDTGDIYAQHVLASGVVDGGWPVNGRAMCTAANAQLNPQIVLDSAGGAIVTWYDARSGVYDIYAQHVLASGAVDVAWPADGRLICGATDTQLAPTLISDGAGGAIVTWQDYRCGHTYDIYAQHVLASGAVDGAWPAGGRAVSTFDDQVGGYTPKSTPTIVTDGGGGAIITWHDYRSSSNYDIYAQRVLASGSVDGTWPANGQALCTNGSDQVTATIVSDGAGGAIVAWYDTRSTTNSWDIYAQHVFGSAVVDPTWPTNGRLICGAPFTQYQAAIASDGAGGAIIAWYDNRTGTNVDIYAQRVAPSGYLGNPEPGITSVRDIPNDNGGKVKLSWNASYLDTEQPYFVDHYWIFRNAPPALATQALAQGARLLSRSDAEPEGRERAFLATTESATTYYWEFIASSPAAHFTSTYSYVASTTSDSMGAGNPRTAFMVVGYNASNTVYFASNADSGYSVDNIPPIAPALFTGNYATGATHLHWNPNAEPDLANYRLYRGSSAGFVPGPGNLVSSPPDTGYAAVGAAGFYYKLSAVDVHGNESGYALLTPSTTTAVGSELVGELAFSRPAPNPASAVATMRLALPREARVTLTVHDIAGREVRSLITETVAAGKRDVVWNLRDATGARVADGIYFMRLAVEGKTITRRVTVVS